MNILYFLIAMLVLAVMICIHELGHYTAGRLLGFKIIDFSIGFGPALLKFKGKKHGIVYALRAIPLGGACRFYGEEDDPEDVKSDPDAIPFNSQKPWKRLIVIFAGPLMNFVLAYVLAVVMMLCYGDQQIVKYPGGDEAIVITQLSEGGRAEQCGVMEDDMILAVNGIDISEYPDSFEGKTDVISKQIDEASADGVTLTVLREGEQVDVFVSSIYNEKAGKNLLGITMGLMVEYKPAGLIESLGSGFKLMWSIVRATFEALANGFKNGFKQNDFSGIVATVAITMKMASMGFYYLLYVAIIITMSLGIMNLLPLLPLDGGHLLFDFIELVFGKPVPRKIQNALSLIGFGLLLLLMVIVTYSDIKGLLNGVFDF